MSLLQRCVDRPATELAAYAPELLLDLKLEASAALAVAQTHVELVDRALELKYNHLAQAQRLAAGKDTGSVTFSDGPVRVSVDLPKKVEWDQAALARIADRIRAAGQDPSEFLAVTYKVSESKYNAWPISMRTSFDPARTLKTGKPTFRLSLLGDAA
ncbi:hypothetical protein [Lysobacter sp. CA199]|uniref:hypothetical protein n=1 Tax=Lysobacter sp. CA199 TaxID=3455608 RepID=UPI003F8CFDA3